MKTEYTPGPWHFDASDMNVYTDDKYSGIATIHRKVKVVGVDDLEVSGLSIQTKANGALIAAAPELLESLQWLVKQIPELQGEISLIGMQKCYEAITKATQS
jgi:hypothetical protein